MPAFGDALTTEEIIYVSLYERVALGGYEAELPLANAIFEKLDHGELELPERFIEVIALVEFEAEITEMLAEVRAELGAGEEVAAG
jgi:hypothetical protein